MKEVFEAHQLDKPKVSVIIPIYSVAAGDLTRCLESLFRQNYLPVEVICVFDGGSEGYLPVIEKFKSQGMDIISVEQRHKGVSAARNHGILKANGKWLLFVDADDWVKNELISELVAGALQTRAEIVMADYIRALKKKEICHYYKDSDELIEVKNNFLFLADILKPQTGAGFVWGKLIEKDFLINNNIFFDEQLEAAEDAEFMLRAAFCADKILYIAKGLYYYCYNQNSAVRKFKKDYMKRYMESLEKMKNFIFSNRQIAGLREDYYNCVLYHLLLGIVNYWFHPENPGNYRSKREDLKKVLERGEIKESLSHIIYKNFTLSRKVTLFFLRLHMFAVVYLIASVRHTQFKIN
ncbi:glycosyltransferase family 2 protein [Cuneatibacter caecimuris]|uniref:Glycosyltransferase EpsJ n=1 Tax=Cuneatibacter caecimuris TaxID=1796618 RepID=A0A4Q7P035_9FIRM|nr:glycosyltransferase family 2 protein [Cuneatibacter caecimuris]RZS92680.1 glycosyltransferase EpsJ [Cuneatibacter caecimuris]